MDEEIKKIIHGICDLALKATGTQYVGDITRVLAYIHGEAPKVEEVAQVVAEVAPEVAPEATVVEAVADVTEEVTADSEAPVATEPAE